MPCGKRRNFYLLAVCKSCKRSASASSFDASNWTFSAIPPCQSLPQAATAAPAASSATKEQQLVECNLCCEDMAAIVSCSAGHKVCGACFDRNIVDFNFTARQTCLKKRQLVAPDLHSWPFMCTLCLEDKVCNLFPIGTCMTLMSEASTRSLFHHLRQFKDEGDGDSVPEVSPSEVAAVKRMVTMFFLPPRCPACHTPFVHDGGCMAMKCRGRAGVICQAHFCLWCLRVPKLVSVLGPHSTENDRDGACHRHVFACPLAPPGSSTPGNSRLFPTEDPTAENSEWIVAPCMLSKFSYVTSGSSTEAVPGPSLVKPDDGSVGAAAGGSVVGPLVQREHFQLRTHASLVILPHMSAHPTCIVYLH